MTRYWVLGLIVAVVALVLAVLRILTVTRSLKEEVDIPLRDADQDKRLDFWSEPVEGGDETVLLR